MFLLISRFCFEEKKCIEKKASSLPDNILENTDVSSCIYIMLYHNLIMGHFNKRIVLCLSGQVLSSILWFNLSQYLNFISKITFERTTSYTFYFILIFIWKMMLNFSIEAPWCIERSMANTESHLVRIQRLSDKHQFMTLSTFNLSRKCALIESVLTDKEDSLNIPSWETSFINIYISLDSKIVASLGWVNIGCIWQKYSRMLLFL